MLQVHFLLPMPNGIIYFFVISKPGGTQKILLVPRGAGKRVEKGKGAHAEKATSACFFSGLDDAG